MEFISDFEIEFSNLFDIWELMLVFFFNIDGVVISRHSRENGNPEVLQLSEKTRFSFSRE